jgi:hypothetical protein
MKGMSREKKRTLINKYQAKKDKERGVLWWGSIVPSGKK